MSEEDGPSGRLLDEQPAQHSAGEAPTAESGLPPRSELSPAALARVAAAIAHEDAALKRIGRYRLVEVIGEGGMGEVWRAEQEHPIRRTVALKLIKLGMDSRQVIARFEGTRKRTT
jgi:serine/threonine protein kinase